MPDAPLADAASHKPAGNRNARRRVTMVKLGDVQHLTTDVLIIGGDVAGIKAD